VLGHELLFIMAMQGWHTYWMLDCEGYCICEHYAYPAAPWLFNVVFSYSLAMWIHMDLLCHEFLNM